MPKRSSTSITKALVDRLINEAREPSFPDRILFDAREPGFGVRLQHAKEPRPSFFIQYRRHRRTRRHAIGFYSSSPESGWSIDKARLEARELLTRIRKDPDFDPTTERRAQRAHSGDTFREIAADYIDRVAKKTQRRWKEAERILATYVTPDWGDRRLSTVTRRDVADLLDHIEDHRGPAQAGKVLDTVRAIFNWRQTRDDDFISPIVRGIGRHLKARPRERILSDPEIHAVWSACDEAEPAVFGSLVKLLLLTGARRNEIAGARWSEIGDARITVPPERVKKTHRDREPPPRTIPLSESARNILASLARLGDYAITTTGSEPFSGFSKAKRAMDRAVLLRLKKDAEERGDDPDDVKLPRWTLHDLRRTARSLMSRAGVRPDHAERVIGHVIRGVEGTYDRHRYDEEKRTAVDALAKLINAIVTGTEAQNVIKLRA